MISLHEAWVSLGPCFVVEWGGTRPGDEAAEEHNLRACGVLLNRFRGSPW